MTSQFAACLVVAVAATGCSSKSETTAPAPAATTQAALGADGAQQPNAASEVGRAPAVNAANPGGGAALPPGAAMPPGGAPVAGAQPPTAANPGEAATANAAAEAKLSEPVGGDELKTACKAVCQRANACKPAGASMSEDTCVEGCGKVPGGEAKRYAVERMTNCSTKTDCSEFNACMANGAAPASPAPPAH
ncbi:MAG: hypothetical protein FJ095_09040 [Deltaproteobacteria bacterium]|nr:hypothetical protein [Deltaproteobacteria bacterium]